MTTALAQYHAPTALTIPPERDFNALWRMSEQFANSGLLLPHFKNKPDAVMAAALTCWSVDMPVNLTTLNQFYEVNGKIQAGTQFCVALAARQGIEVWFDDACDDRHAIAYARRLPDGRVHRYEFTWEMAEKAKLTSKDNWKHPEIMLRYRAASRILRTSFPESYMGLPPSVIDEGLDPVDRHALEQGAIDEAADVADVEVADSWPAAVVPAEWVTKLVSGCATKLWPDDTDVTTKCAALVEYATGGRTSDPSDVRADHEKAAVEEAFRRIQSGELALEPRWAVTIDEGDAPDDEAIADAELVEHDAAATTAEPPVDQAAPAAEDPTRPFTED